jgi:hypothetical protein
VAVRKRGVLILECLDKADPGSEGMFLSQMLRLMEVEHQYVEVRTKRQFLALLGMSPFEIVHITTHGAYRRRLGKKKFRGFRMPGGALRASDLESVKGKLKGCSVVTTACLSGDHKFAKAFAEATHCTHYVAPSGSPTFKGAIFFAHIVYHKLFVMRKTLRRILAEYDRRYRNVYDFAILSFGKYIKKTME